MAGEERIYYYPKIMEEVQKGKIIMDRQDRHIGRGFVSQDIYTRRNRKYVKRRIPKEQNSDNGTVKRTGKPNRNWRMSEQNKSQQHQKQPAKVTTINGRHVFMED